MSYLVQLLGWVVFQVAWQTLAVALLLLLSLRFMRRASAARRYHCAELHLVGALGAVVLSLIVSHASVAVTPALASADNERASWLPGLHNQIQPFLPAVAWTWFGGTAIAQALLAVRFIRLRRFIKGTTPASRAVAAMVEEMSFDIGLSRPPHVRCAGIRSPMVAGRRSTFLVVPRAFGETHPPAEMRALLAHELAHLLRRDYSRNFLQLFATSLLWWHPGAWLIYVRIRHERECASDEHAVRITGSAASLANALFRLADASMSTESVLIAADSSGLADRISRLSAPQGRPARETIPPFLVGVFVALTAVIVAASSTASRGEALTRAYAASAVGPSTVFTFRAHDPAGTFLVKMIRGRVVAIELGQKPVPSDQVVQRGDTVRVVGGAGRELLRLEVDPRGGIRWTPRRPS
jgi:beta-lactamase regulating signal transducer with metallopeptidase domain